MKRKVSLVVFSAAVLAACGTAQDQEKQDQALEQEETAKVVEEAAPAEEAEALPAMIIARVPVDAQGNEILDAVETRVVGQEMAFDSESAAEQAFASGERVTFADELDRDSSTESGSRWNAYWNTPWYPGKLLGRGLTWGRNPYVSYGNYYYGYRYSYSYYYPRYRYYTYCRTNYRYYYY